MKDYIVKFVFMGLCFNERARVYGVNSRREAIQAVKDQFGGSVKIIGAREIKYDKNGNEVAW